MTARDLGNAARRAATTWGPAVFGAGYLAERAIAGVLAKLGHPGAPLDDAYIHFQYARALVEGHPMRFEAGEPITSGATSFLWPAALAPFWALGAKGEGIVWAAWGLAFVALAALAWEAVRLTEPIAGRAAATGAGAMILCFGGLVWCAASGMEVVPFAWAIARSTRRAVEWWERAPAERTRRMALELVALAWVSALLRPEGAVTTVFVAATFAASSLRSPRTRAWPARAASLAAIAAAAAPPLLLLLCTGSARSNTAVAKLLPGNPYYPGPVLARAVQANVELLLGTILNGEVWSAEFLPRGGAGVAIAGLFAIAWLGGRRRLRWRATGILLIAATMFAPCFYATFLWNRLRYLWPFATGWIVGLACLARIAGDVAGALRPRWRVATPIACGAFAGLFASKLGWVMDDVAQSASGIDRQQVALGHWANDNLPPDARVGLNDTGAIAYFGDRKTFDVVGLTTADEAKYWVAGVGSRLEHYERLQAEAPWKLPTHFIVYPEWMALDEVLGQPLHEATVTDSTILGGRTMRAYVADWSALGSGEAPWSQVGAIIDSLDVADLESEGAHEYDLLGAVEGEDIVHAGPSPRGVVVVDGGRSRRTAERFVAHLRPGVATTLVVRLEGPAHARVLAGGTAIASFSAGGDEWVERAFDMPADLASERTLISVDATGGALTTFHYWFASNDTSASKAPRP
ncbi:MAG TPA: hypothetical protein VGM06_21180 [Polyangiaceae bacterium]